MGGQRLAQLGDAIAMVRRLALGVTLITGIAVAAFVPPGPGHIKLANPSDACTPVETPSGLIYPSSSTIYDTTEPVEHGLTGQPLCPRGFVDMNVFVIRRTEATGPPPKSWRCIRNRQEFECPRASYSE